MHIHSVSLNIDENSPIGELSAVWNKKKEEIAGDLILLKEKENVLKHTNQMILTTESDVLNLEKKNSFGLNTKQINDRMSKFYETENNTLRPIVTTLRYFYWFIVIPLALINLVSFKNIYSTAISIFILITPFFLNKITDYFFNTNNCPTFLPSLGFESGGSKTCQMVRT